MVNRLTDHALGIIELSNTQVRAIEILLKKSIPDLSQVQMEHDVSDDAVKVIKRMIVGSDGTDNSNA